MTLTAREKDFIRLAALGLPDKEIGFRLGISEYSTKTAFYRLRRKIGRIDRCAFPGLALLLGLVSVEDICQPARKITTFLEGPKNT